MEVQSGAIEYKYPPLQSANLLYVIVTGPATTTKSSQHFTSKKILQINMCNSKVAYIFATLELRN
jgi:hypothetical protein